MQPRLARSSTVARPVPPPAKTVERPPEKPVEFTLKKPQAKSVMLAGTFNGWDPKRTPMRNRANGWCATLWLPPGRYEYRFVVDGEWMSDPHERDSAPNEFGGTNSVLVVT